MHGEAGGITGARGHLRHAGPRQQREAPGHPNSRPDAVVSFKPTEPRDYSGEFVIRRADSCPQRTVQIKGRGVVSCLTWSATRRMAPGLVDELRQRLPGRGARGHRHLQQRVQRRRRSLERAHQRSGVRGHPAAGNDLTEPPPARFACATSMATGLRAPAPPCWTSAPWCSAPSRASCWRPPRSARSPASRSPCAPSAAARASSAPVADLRDRPRGLHARRDARHLRPAHLARGERGQPPDARGSRGEPAPGHDGQGTSTGAFAPSPATSKSSASVSGTREQRLRGHPLLGALRPLNGIEAVHGQALNLPVRVVPHTAGQKEWELTSIPTTPRSRRSWCASPPRPSRCRPATTPCRPPTSPSASWTCRSRRPLFTLTNLGTTPERGLLLQRPRSLADHVRCLHAPRRDERRQLNAGQTPP